jgi:AcrR family transcriptional regulator
VARKAGIDRERVVDTAAGIADRGGLAALSLATVADALGVRSPSLYAHVDGIDGLRRHLTRRASLLLAECLRSAAREEADPVAALRSIAHAYRSFALQHPGLYASLLPVPRAEDDPEGAAAAAAAIEAPAAVLRDLGIGVDRQIDLVRALRATLHGFVDLELGGGFGLADPVDVSFERAVDLLVGAMVDAAAAAGSG